MASTTIREALVPAAGRGARLDRPGTPKPLVTLGGVPLLLRNLRQLARAGVERAVVVVGYEADSVRCAVACRRDLGLVVEVVEHPGWAAGLASSVRAARGLLQGRFLLAMADHAWDDATVRRMAAVEVEAGGIVGLVDAEPRRVRDRASAVRVRLDGDRIVAIGRGLTPYHAIDAGLFAATPELFEALAVADGGELSDGVRVLAEGGRCAAVRVGEALWDDVDTPADLVQAELRLRRRRRGAAVSPEVGPRPPATTYRFTTGAPARTDVVVARGIVRGPAPFRMICADSASSPVFVVTDGTVDRLYGERFVGRLRAQGYDVRRVVVADGEGAKTLASYGYLMEQIVSAGPDALSVVVSLGGGAVCNVSGFLASTLFRGVTLVHVPTTLMAQCDAAISHKQAINGARGKNLVGSYYAPQAVFVDVQVLQSLDDRQLRDGLAEALKHALAQDRAYLRSLLERPVDLRDPDFLEWVVRRNVELKCQLMQRDPKELGEGMVLQYGHTVGHAVEHLSGYGLTHGEAVAIGMMAAARTARLMGACGEELVDVHTRLLERYGLPTAIPDGIGADAIVDTIRSDKRYLVEGVRMALLDRPGRLWSVDGEHAIPVPDDVLARALAGCRAGSARSLRS